MRRKFKDPVMTKPCDVESGDAFAVKVVAVVGHGDDWSAFVGPTDWPDEKVARQGDGLLREQAEPLFYVLRASGRHYWN